MQFHLNDSTTIEINVSDDSYRLRQLTGEHSLTLQFSLPEYVDFPIGTWTEFDGERYTLYDPATFTKNGMRKYDYTLVMQSEQAKLGMYIFRDPIDGRVKFPLTAQPEEHLKMLVDNLNLRDSGWTAGECIDAVENTVSYDHTFCLDALNQIADTFNTEWEIVGKTISLRKVEYFKESPLHLSYGRGKGIVPGLGRANYDSSRAIDVLYVQGGTQNIDPSRYGSSELRLPKGVQYGYDGQHFLGEEGYVPSVLTMYHTSADGLSVRVPVPSQLHNEGSLDLSNIYPNWEHTVTQAQEVRPGVWDIYAENTEEYPNNSPESLNYDDCRIAGETATVVFQSGMLAGKEFDIRQTENALTGYDHKTKKFELVSQEYDGQSMPNTTYAPAVGDKFRLFGIRLPDTYVCDNESRTGASWDMLREAIKYLYDNGSPKFSYPITLDGNFTRADWTNIGGRIKCGAYVRLTDTQFLPEGENIRIVSVKDYVNKPHAPEIELSNKATGASFSSRIDKIESEEVVNEERHQQAIRFTRRRFADARQSIAMLENALLDGFSEAVRPVAVQTMQMLVGNPALQFQFFNDNGTIPLPYEWNKESRTLHIDIVGVRHMTLGIDTISSDHDGKYRTWIIQEYESARLEDADKSYYLYIKCSETSLGGEFLLSEQAIGMEEESGYYHLLAGILNREGEDGERSFLSLYGFTEISPGQVLTDRIVTADGKSFIDLVANALHLGGDNSYLDWNNRVKDTLSTVNLLLENATIKNKLNVQGKARIAGFDFSNTVIESTKTLGQEAAITLDGVNGRIKVVSPKGGNGVYTPFKATIDIDSTAGGIWIEGETEHQAVIVTGGGIRSNVANIPITETAPASVRHIYSAVVGSGYPISDLDGSGYAVVGVYGTAQNSGSSPTYGGYFNRLRANGLILNILTVSDDSPSSQTMGYLYTAIVSFVSSGTRTVVLPTTAYEGQFIYIKQIGAGILRVAAGGSQIILDDRSPNDYKDFAEGWGGIALFKKVSINNTSYGAWLINRFSI